MKNRLIKCSNWDIQDFGFTSYFTSASWFYLHGKAEDVNNFDCIEANAEALRWMMSSRAFICTLLMKDQEIFNFTPNCIGFSWYEDNAMTGLICLLEDLKGIKEALNYGKVKKYTGMLHDDEIFIKENYPEVKKLLAEYRRKIG